MFWVHVFFVVLLSKIAIRQVREHSDWFAAISILGVVLNALAIIA